MSYLVMARKYRPRNFEEVVGQPHVVKTLKNALQKGRFAHAYIFYGPRGVGKTTTARILARCLNCVEGPTISPCGKCSPCREILTGTSLDVLEIDAASNRGIDEIRNLRENVRFSPAGGKFRVYIIDEIHMLTIPAFNAFLKTLEEPPSHAVFIGATTEIEQIPRTVLSRVQRFNFRLVPRQEIADYLKQISEREKIEITEDALDIIAGKANGSLRDGLGLLDQLAAFCEDAITSDEVRAALGVIESNLFFRAMEAVTGRGSADVFRLVEELSGVGADPAEFMRGFADHFRDLLLIKSSGSSKIIEGTEAYRERMMEASDKFSELDLVRLMKLSFDSVAELKRSQTPMLGLELRLLQMLKLHDTPELSNLIEEYQKGLSPETPAAPLSTPELFSQDAEGKSSGNKSHNSLQKPEINNRTSALPAEVDTEMSTDDSMNLGLKAKGESPSPSSISEPHSGLKRLKESWGEICDVLKKHNNHLGFFLMDSTPERMKGNTVEIACPNDFQTNRLSANRQLVQNAVKDTVNMTVMVKFVKGATKTEKNQLGNSMKGRRELLEELMKNDPVLKELVERFEAEPI